MEKTVYWIDDSIQRMSFIMQGVFPRFWGLNQSGSKYKIKIIIFGNQSQVDDKKLYTYQDEWRFQNKLEDFLFETCHSYSGIAWENSMYEELRGLIEGAVEILFKEWPADSDLEKKIGESWETWRKKNDLYVELYRLWQSVGDERTQECVLPQKASDKVGELIELINISEHACVGIDLALLYGDIEYIKNNQCQIISMELYHQIKKKHKCFLYSTSTHDKDFIDTWKAVYSKCYQESDIKIYQRIDLMEKRTSDSTIDEIMNMLEEGQAEE